MNIQLRIKNSDNTEIINVENVDDINCFEYEDSYGANNKLTILDNGISVIRKADSHDSEILLKTNENSFVSIKTNEGIMKFDAKVLAFERNNDIITLVYKVNEDENSIEIKIVGASI
ncbi:MAG: hypothetical protein Q4F12_03705 [Erysipelotrichaceae bacterium]|nr:hypothetical protein [Erysipelotrichaceae bacterium]